MYYQHGFIDDETEIRGIINFQDQTSKELFIPTQISGDPRCCAVQKAVPK